MLFCFILQISRKTTDPSNMKLRLHHAKSTECTQTADDQDDNQDLILNTNAMNGSIKGHNDKEKTLAISRFHTDLVEKL